MTFGFFSIFLPEKLVFYEYIMHIRIHREKLYQMVFKKIKIAELLRVRNLRNRIKYRKKKEKIIFKFE